MAFTLIPWLTTGAQLFDSKQNPLLTFDSNLTESHTYTARITDRPVEDGSPISDHVVLEPIMLNAEVVMSDIPINDDNPDPDRSRTMFRTLLDLWETKEPMTVVTGLTTYDSMVIEQIEVMRDKDTSFEVNASVVWKQIRIAESVTVLIPERLLRADVKDKGQDTVDVGQQGTDEDANAEDESQTVARAYLGGEVDFSFLRF